MELPEDKRAAILEAIYGGPPRKIEAIKLVREATGCGLKEAKEFVEKLGAELYAKEPAKFTAVPTGKSGCVGVVMLVAVIFGVAAIVVKMSV
ncbi:MAG: ribosomal protein L7/L12 [Verrucomicrobia bacterium]|nr:ribosomal protein L7/L12 [Verrucomicrobiota bacterium]